MNLLLDIIDYAPTAVIAVATCLTVAVIAFFYDRAEERKERSRREAGAAPSPDDYDIRLLEDVEWRGIGYDAWLEQYEREQERER